MRIFTKSGLILLFLFPMISCSQNYFEGEIIYDLEYIRKDSTFKLENIGSWPARTATTISKNGNWIQRMDDGVFEYEYFNRQLNQQFYKVRRSDTLLFLNYNQRPLELDSILSIKTLKGTDTILGKVCDKLILETKSMTLTFLYNNYLKIDPEWYKNTKGGYYNVIYSHTKSLFLMAIIETKQYISKIKAKNVTFKNIADESFPDLASFPKKKID